MAAAGDDPDAAAALAGYARTLADAAGAAIPGWVERSVRRVADAQGLGWDPAAEERLVEVAEQARQAGSRRLRELLATDIDEQRSNPLSVLRSLVTYPSQRLREMGARPVDRDEFAERAFPDDVYGLSPAAFVDVDPSLHEPGLVWGAAKAHVHLARRRREGLR